MFCPLLFEAQLVWEIFKTVEQSFYAANFTCDCLKENTAESKWVELIISFVWLRTVNPPGSLDQGSSVGPGAWVKHPLLLIKVAVCYNTKNVKGGLVIYQHWPCTVGIVWFCIVMNQMIMNSRSPLVIVMSLCFSKSPKYKIGLLPYSMLSLIIKGIFSIHKFVKLIYFSPVVLYTPPNYFQIYIYLFIYLLYRQKCFTKK